MRDTRIASKTIFLTAASAIAIMAAAATAVAQDATQQEKTASRLEEIVVTARQIKESLQDTPVAVTAFSQEQIESRGLRNLVDVASLAPNTNFSIGGDGVGSSSNAVVYIRGIGQKDFSPTNDPGVGIYLDGVYLARSIGSVLEVADAQQVEVLRGPQGTLFGRNNLGGAVKLTTRDPGDEFAGRYRAVFGQLDRAEISGTVDIPISDTLKTSITGLYKHREGFVKRLDGIDLNDVDVKAGRFKTIWTPTDKIKLTLIGDASFENPNGGGEVSVDVPENGFFVDSFNNNVLLDAFGIKGATQADGTPDLSCAVNGGPLDNPNCANDQFLLGPFRSAETAPQSTDISTWGVTMIGDFVFSPEFSLKSITAYREVHALFNRAEDGTPFPLIFNTNNFDQKQFSQEFQFISSLLDDRLQTVSGFYYFTEEGSNDQTTQFYRNDVIPNHFGGNTDNYNWSLFTESTLSVTERWRLIAGGRFTRERKKFSVFSFIENPFNREPGDPLFDSLDRNILSGNALLPGVSIVKKPSWRFGTQFDVTDDVMAYATASRGFKSGGFNLRLTNPTSENPSFGPEFVNNYEVGVKTEMPEIGLRFNLTAFWMRYTNIQVAANIPPEINTITFNGGTGRIRGVEIDALFQPTDNLTISGAFGYQDAEFTKVLPGVVVRESDNFIRTPEVSGNLYIENHFNIPNVGHLTPRVSWKYSSSVEFEVVNNPLVRQKAYSVFDASVTYLLPDREDISFTFGVDNFTDKTYAVAGSAVPECCFVLKQFAQPRNWYLSVSHEF